MEGSITLRKDGRYMGRIYENGRPKCLYARTKKEIVEKMKEEIKQKKQREKQEITTNYYNLTFGDFAKDYLEIFKKPTLKESSFHNFELLFKRYSKSKIYKMKIKDITHHDLKRFYDCVDVNYSSYAFFKDIFEKAKEIGITCFNPFCMIVKPKMAEQEEKQKPGSDILKESEVEKIFNFNFGSRKYNVLFKFLYLTGLRVSEALALTVNDIDFEKKELHVNKQIMIYSGKISSTKSKTSNRIVPLFNETIELLNDHLKNINSDRLFELKYVTVKYKLRLVGEELEIKIKSHMFRKTFVSRMQFDFGISADVVASWVGHIDTKTTKEYYTFLTDDANKNAIDEINKKMKK